MEVEQQHDEEVQTMRAGVEIGLSRSKPSNPHHHHGDGHNDVIRDEGADPVRAEVATHHGQYASQLVVALISPGALRYPSKYITEMLRS